MDWKKEIKLSDLVGRKRKPDAPAAPQPAAAEKPVPFWKKEISLGRKPKAEPATPSEPAALAPVADENWVREQLAAAAAAAAAEAPTEPLASPAAPPPPAPGVHPPVPASELPPPPKEKKAKQSVLKKEISFRRKPKAPKEPKPHVFLWSVLWSVLCALTTHLLGYHDQSDWSWAHNLGRCRLGCLC